MPFELHLNKFKYQFPPFLASHYSSTCFNTGQIKPALARAVSFAIFTPALQAFLPHLSSVEHIFHQTVVSKRFIVFFFCCPCASIGTASLPKNGKYTTGRSQFTSMNHNEELFTSVLGFRRMRMRVKQLSDLGLVLLFLYLAGCSN